MSNKWELYEFFLAAGRRKSPFPSVPSTPIPSEVGKMVILSSLLPSLSELTFHSEYLQCVFLHGQNFLRLENAPDFYPFPQCPERLL